MTSARSPAVTRRKVVRWLLLARGAAGLLAAASAYAPAWAEAKPDLAAAVVEHIDVHAKPLGHFERGKPEQRRFGNLEFRGGIVLSSDHKLFGGWSGIEIAPDGRRFLAVSDAGVWLKGEIGYDGTRPVSIAAARIGPLLARDGRPLGRERDRDAEAIRLLDGTLERGRFLIGFEQNHRIGIFEVNDHGIQAPVSYLKLPPETPRMSRNKGFEAVAVLRGGPLKGTIIAFAERLPDRQGHHTGWLWVKGEPQRIGLSETAGFDVTDAAGLPDGGLLVLQRRFRWLEGVKMRLRRVGPGEIRPGALLEGELLLEADMGFEIDNMEGLAVHTGPRGETIVTLISDDNYSAFLQRTILLQFALAAEETRSSAARPAGIGGAARR